jgi:hypothetical protein
MTIKSRESIDRERAERLNPKRERYNLCDRKRWTVFDPGYVPPPRCACGEALGSGEDCPLCAQERIRMNQPEELWEIGDEEESY